MPATALKPATEAQGQTALAVMAFMQGFSIEATRPDADELVALKSVLPAGTAVTLTAIPRRPHSELIAGATRLRAQGFEPIPHLAARSVSSHGALDDLLSRLSALAGVRRVLAIGGDSERAEGPFNSAIELIESGLLQRYRIVEVGIAGYPEGHPRLPPETLDRALAAKIEAAGQTGLGITIVTQFAFDPVAILIWVRRLRDLGIEHPVRIGMAGPSDLSTLLRYARRCGVRASAQGLTRQAGLIKHLLGVSTPAAIIRPLAEAQAQVQAQVQANGQLGRVAAHFFSFGGAAATARWAKAVAAGRIVLDRTEGFGVEPP
jgi:methylenetetrahydrofolate reductase (NADPH)